MQTLNMILSAKSVPHYVRSDREVLLFVQAKTMQDGIMNQCEDYGRIVASYSEALQKAFHPDLHIRLLDGETSLDADEFSDVIVILVEPKDD